MNIVLMVLLIVSTSGEMHRAEQPMKSMEECLTSAGKFLEQDPDDFNARMIAASCNKIAVGTKS